MYKDEHVQVRQEAIRIAMDILKDKDNSTNPEEVLATADKVAKFILNIKEVK